MCQSLVQVLMVTACVNILLILLSLIPAIMVISRFPHVIWHRKFRSWYYPFKSKPHSSIEITIFIFCNSLTTKFVLAYQCLLNFLFFDGSRSISFLLQYLRISIFQFSSPWSCSYKPQRCIWLQTPASGSAFSLWDLLQCSLEFFELLRINLTNLPKLEPFTVLKMTDSYIEYVRAKNLMILKLQQRIDKDCFFVYKRCTLNMDLEMRIQLKPFVLN